MRPADRCNALGTSGQGHAAVTGARCPWAAGGERASETVGSQEGP